MIRIDDLNRLMAHDLEDLCALNNRFHAETSWLVSDDWRKLRTTSKIARVALDATESLMGFIIAFDQDGDYGSINFQWFRGRLERFLYIDRVLVHPDHQRKGVAQALYADLMATAATGGYGVIVCEVNQDPPNPASEAFHNRLGFKEMGRQVLPSAKTVSYLRLDL